MHRRGLGWVIGNMELRHFRILNNMVVVWICENDIPGSSLDGRNLWTNIVSPKMSRSGAPAILWIWCVLNTFQFCKVQSLTCCFEKSCKSKHGNFMNCWCQAIIKAPTHNHWGIPLKHIRPLHHNFACRSVSYYSVLKMYLARFTSKTKRDTLKGFIIIMLFTEETVCTTTRNAKEGDV